MSEEKRAVTEELIEELIAQEDRIMDMEARGEISYQKADRDLLSLEKQIKKLEAELAQ